jgi:Protein of unknown function (DUF3244).
MKKTLTLCTLLLISSWSSYIYSVETDNRKETKEIKLKSERDKKLIKSAPVLPSINAYLSDDGIEIIFNEEISQDVIVTISTDNNEVIYSEVIQVSAPTNWPIFIDFDEENSYHLEIFTLNWSFYGDF